MTENLMLHALDGSNPLGYLAALGTLRLVSLDEFGARMAWTRDGGFWRPVLCGVGLGEEALCTVLSKGHHWVPVDEFLTTVGKNIKVPPEKFKVLVENASGKASVVDRRAADYAAAFGCEVCEDDKGKIEYTDFCFITGSGHQDFLGTMESLAQVVGEQHLFDALFGEWKLEKGLSMRWDPQDASEYALQWGNPSSEGASAVWGANRLAFEALPLFPTAPVSGGLGTTGFERRQRLDELTWPIWEPSLGVDTIRSLLSHSELQQAEPDRTRLQEMGICDILRAQRVRIGQGANFKTSFRAARSV